MGKIVQHEDLLEVLEGRARILVPKSYTLKGPGSARGGPFYNREMGFSRDVSILLLEALGSDVRRVLDGLSSTGVLGIRFALEAGGGFEITLNDRRRDAQRLIRKNIRLNGVRGATVSGEDLNVLLNQGHFDYVDVDPFGSPIPFLDGALRALRPKGYLAVTATDTAALSGAYPRTCLRRYGAMPARVTFRHEVGVRILVGAVVRSAAKYDLAAKPLLAFWRGHYYRSFFAIDSGARRADSVLEGIGYVDYLDGARTVGTRGDIGPLWTGSLYSGELLERVKVKDYMLGTVSRYHEVWSEEAEAPPLFYTTDEVASRLHVSPPSVDAAMEALVEAGFVAHRTTFHPKGIKTTATWDEILRLLGSF